MQEKPVNPQFNDDVYLNVYYENLRTAHGFLKDLRSEPSYGEIDHMLQRAIDSAEDAMYVAEAIACHLYDHPTR